MRRFHSQGSLNIIVVLFLTTLILYIPILKNPSILLNRGNDLEEFFWPIFFYVKNSILSSGQIPLWNNLFFSGAPLISDPQSGIFYLPNILFLILPIDSAFILSIFFHSLLGGVSMFLLSTYGFKFSRGASLFTAILYILLPRTIGFVEAGHFGLITASAWIPLIILSTIKMGLSVSFRWPVLFAFCQTFIFFNHIIISTLTLFSAVIIFVLNIFFFRSIKKFLSLIIGLILTFGLSSIALFPQLEWLPNTTRSLLLQHPDVYPKWNSFSEFLLTFFYPWQLQISSIDSEKWVSIGIFTIILAGIGFIYIDKNKKLILSICALITTLIALNNLSPLYAFLLNQDIFVLTRVATRVLIINQIIFIILAGLGVNILLKKNLSGLCIGILIFAVFLEVLLLDWGRLTITPSKGGQVPEEVYQYLETNNKFRVFCTTRCIPQKEAAIRGLELMEGYGTLQQKNYYDQFIQLSQVYWDRYTLSLPPFEVYLQNEIQPFSPELSDYNVKYVIAPYKLKDKNLLLTGHIGQYLIYENTIVKSRAFFSDGSEAQLITHSPNFIRVNTTAHPSLEFTLSEVWNPNWKAYLNGVEEVTIAEPKNKLRNVKIKEDTKFVDFKFQPVSLVWGSSITVVTLISIVFISILKWKKIGKF